MDRGRLERDDLLRYAPVGLDETNVDHLQGYGVFDPVPQ
jgi:hypothetical protein